MNIPWQLKAAHTIDLGYEQLLMLEDERGTRIKVLFRGVWLSECIDAVPRVAMTEGVLPWNCNRDR